MEKYIQYSAEAVVSNYSLAINKEKYRKQISAIMPAPQLPQYYLLMFFENPFKFKISFDI